MSAAGRGIPGLTKRRSKLHKNGGRGGARKLEGRLICGMLEITGKGEKKGRPSCSRVFERNMVWES